MIRLKLPAEMACDAKDCGASIDARLILLGTGGFGFLPLNGPTWQLQLDRRNPASPFITLCPKHAESIITPAAQKRVIADAH